MRRLALAIFWVLSGTTKDNPPDPQYLAEGMPHGGSGPFPEPSSSHAHAAPVIRAHSSALLLVYSLVFVALGRFHRHLGRFNLLGQLLQLAMVGLPVATSVTGFDSSALLHAIAQRVPGYQGLYTDMFEREEKRKDLYFSAINNSTISQKTFFYIYERDRSFMKLLMNDLNDI